MHQPLEEPTYYHAGHELERNEYSTTICVRCGASCMKAGSFAIPDEPYDLWRAPGEIDYLTDIPACVTVH